jgi:hypothetical protein
MQYRSFKRGAIPEEITQNGNGGIVDQDIYMT